MKVCALALIIIWSVGCAGIGIKDLTAAVSMRGCAEAKVTLEDGEIDWSAGVEVCGKATALGFDLPDVCLGVETP